MPKLRWLSQREVLNIFADFGFAVVAQKGSHMKLRRQTDVGFQTLTIPNHKEIDIGTLKAIFNQASRFIPENELRDRFYGG